MRYADYVKSQVSKKDFKIIKRLNINLNERRIADLWPAFVNYKKRSAKEIPFIISNLKNIKKLKIFDSTLGSGATSIGLKEANITDVISNEVDQNYIKIAKEEAKRRKIKLSIKSIDWRYIDTKIKIKFDCILCLGNSITYLFKRKDQIKTLKNFYNILKDNGKLIIDERNYSDILAGNYKHSRKYIYCGTEVFAKPIYVNKTIIIMEYQKGDVIAHLALYPFKKGELLNLLKISGFKKITTYYDYNRKYSKNCEFITYVAEK